GCALARSLPISSRSDGSCGANNQSRRLNTSGLELALSMPGSPCPATLSSAVCWSIMVGPCLRSTTRTFMAPDNLHTQILDNLKTAILLVEPDLRVSYLNPAAEALLETSRSRALGEPITQLFTEPGDTAAGLREAVRGGAAFTKRETLLTLPNGQQITVDYAVTPVPEAELRISLILELQPLDRLLRISRDEGILSSQENTRALVRGLAHEIKNPLGGLRGAAQLLARELPDSGLKDYTNIIIQEADRLRNLVDRMLGPH